MASADGCFVWKNREIDIVEPEQKAILIFDKGWEDLILEVKYEGPASEFGWIVPLPEKPSMSPGKARMFEELSQRTQVLHYGQSLRGRRLRGGSLGAHASTVRVLEKQRVGIYETTVLASDTGDALKDWLRLNSFQLPERAGPVLDEYARKRWVFVAMKIAADAADSTAERKLTSGTIDPIRYRFRTPEPVFPLKISSINAGKSDVLVYVLAHDQVVNRTCQRGTWETRMCGPMEGLSYVDPDSHYSANGLPSFFVSKLRATLGPDEMEDLTFSPYDPLIGLLSANPWDRTEAATYIGSRKRTDAVGALIAFLDSHGPVISRMQDDLSALWALGELQDRAAVPCLSRWAADRPSDISLEALNSLSRIGDRTTLPLFIGALEKTAYAGKRDAASVAIRDLAVETLVAQGDSACLPLLSRVTHDVVARDPWVTLYEAPDRGSGEIAALAACGDAGARRKILKSLISGSAVTEAEDLVREASRGGSTNGFPSGFWIGETLIIDSPDPYPGRWPALGVAVSLLKYRPALLDSLLRDAAADRRVPDAGKVLLLGCLTSPESRDRLKLQQLWKTSLTTKAMIAPVPLDVRWCPGWGYSEPYNLEACSIVYAFTRWGDAESLRQLWVDCPIDETTLRAEIAFGLARCRHAEDLNRVAEYASRDWSRKAGTVNFEERLGTAAAMVPERGRRDWRYSNGNWIDTVYRADEIERFILATPGGLEAMENLISDSKLHPVVRLYWVSLACSRARDSATFPAVASSALIEINAGIEPGTQMAALAADVRRRVEAAIHPSPTRSRDR